jgi:hypothetical protein
MKEIWSGMECDSNKKFKKKIMLMSLIFEYPDFLSFINAFSMWRNP